MITKLTPAGAVCFLRKTIDQTVLAVAKTSKLAVLREAAAEKSTRFQNAQICPNCTDCPEQCPGR